MYATINGHTKESMKTAIKLHNNGTAAIVNIRGCSYLTPDGNRCPIGCFIPDNHPGLKYSGHVGALLALYPDLADKMPLNANELDEMQSVHDQIVQLDKDTNVHDAVFKWIDANVFDALPSVNSTVEKN